MNNHQIIASWLLNIHMWVESHRYFYCRHIGDCTLDFTFVMSPHKNADTLELYFGAHLDVHDENGEQYSLFSYSGPSLMDVLTLAATNMPFAAMDFCYEQGEYSEDEPIDISFGSIQIPPGLFNNITVTI